MRGALAVHVCPSQQHRRTNVAFNISFFFAFIILFLSLSNAVAAVSASRGTDVYGYERQGIYTDGTVMLFRGGLAAFKGRRFKDARRIWEFTSRLGNAPSQYMLGHLYRNGWGVDADIRAAYGWYVAAATQQVPAAQFRLGLAYFRVGDMNNTMVWWRKAAKGGYLAAQYNIGLVHLFGHGVKKNTDEASRWLHRAAYHGSAHAQFYIGLMYLRGDGVTEDREIAQRWFSRSATNGFEYATTDLDEIDEKIVTPIYAQ